MGAKHGPGLDFADDRFLSRIILPTPIIATARLDGSGRKLPWLSPPLCHPVRYAGDAAQNGDQAGGFGDGVRIPLYDASVA